MKKGERYRLLKHPYPLHPHTHPNAGVEPPSTLTPTSFPSLQPLTQFSLPASSTLFFLPFTPLLTLAQHSYLICHIAFPLPSSATSSSLSSPHTHLPLFASLTPATCQDACNTFYEYLNPSTMLIGCTLKSISLSLFCIPDSHV